MGPVSEKPGAIVVETNRFDVVLGRGKNANNRPGNISFRKLTLNLVGKYQECTSGEEKTEMAEQIIAEIHTQGGRFVRSVTAADSKGRHIGAWEIVSNEVAVAKVKQAMRDIISAAKKKKARISSRNEEEKDNLQEVARRPSSAPNGPSPWQFNDPSAAEKHHQLEMAHQRNRLVEMIRYQQQSRHPTVPVSNHLSSLVQWPQQMQSMDMQHQQLPTLLSAGLPGTIPSQQNLLPMLQLQQMQQREQYLRDSMMHSAAHQGAQSSLGSPQYPDVASSPLAEMGGRRPRMLPYPPPVQSTDQLVQRGATSSHLQHHQPHFDPAVGQLDAQAQSAEESSRLRGLSDAATGASNMHLPVPSTDRGQQQFRGTEANGLPQQGSPLLFARPSNGASPGFPLLSSAIGQGRQQGIHHHHWVGASQEHNQRAEDSITRPQPQEGATSYRFLPIPPPRLEEGMDDGKPKPKLDPLPDLKGKASSSGEHTSVLFLGENASAGSGETSTTTS